MDPKLREYHQWLQVLLYYLHLPDWPEAELGISQNEALVLIANYLSLNPDDPEFLEKAFSELSRILAQEKEGPSLPKNLQELVEDYENYLNQLQEKSSADLFPELDQKTQAVYQQYQEEIEAVLGQVEKFENNPLLAKKVSQQIALELTTHLPQIAVEAAFDKTMPAKDYQELVGQTITKRLEPLRVVPFIPFLVKKISQETQPQASSLAATPRTPPSVPSKAVPSKETPPAAKPVTTPEKEIPVTRETAAARIPVAAPAKPITPSAEKAPVAARAVEAVSEKAEPAGWYPRLVTQVKQVFRPVKVTPPVAATPPAPTPTPEKETPVVARKAAVTKPITPSAKKTPVAAKTVETAPLSLPQRLATRIKQTLGMTPPTPVVTEKAPPVKTPAVEEVPVAGAVQVGEPPVAKEVPTGVSGVSVEAPKVVEAVTEQVKPAGWYPRLVTQIRQGLGLKAVPAPAPAVPTQPLIFAGKEVPAAVTDKLSLEPQGVAFKSAFVLLNPPAAVSFSKKIALTPIVKPLQWAVKLAPERVLEGVKAAIIDGLHSEDIKASIKSFEEAGLPQADPLLDQLKNQAEVLEEFETSHPLLSSVLRHYHEFSKRIQGQPIQEPKTRIFLPRLSPSPFWQKPRTYASSLRRGLNRLGTFFKTHQWTLPQAGTRLIRFSLPNRLVRFFTFGRVKSFTGLKSAIYGKTVKPILLWLGKSGLGKAVKTGFKKAAGWVLGKLGLAALPEPVSKVILLATLAKDALKLLKGGISFLARKFKEKPEVFLAIGAALVAAPIVLPVLAVIGTILTGIGLVVSALGALGTAAKWLGSTATQVGGFLSSAASTVGSFFSSLATFSLPANLPLIGTVGTLGAVGITSFIIFNQIVPASMLVDYQQQYQQQYGPIFFGSCYVEDIHQTNVITDENKANFVAEWQAKYPHSLLAEKIDQVIAEAISIGFNPALAVAIWGGETHFSNYASAGGDQGVVAGNDFGCGVYCTNNKPINFDESLACFVAKQASCNNTCLSKATFAEFMECYGPAASNPNFIPNALMFYQDLVPSGPGAINCPGGTTGEFASQLLNQLIACYGNVINSSAYNDNGACLLNLGVPSAVVNHITWSVNQFGALQCVGFAKAVEVATGAQGLGFVTGSHGDAADYYRPTFGYQQIPKSQQNVMIGDLAFFSGVVGHVGIVVEVSSDMSWFRIAQAIGYNSSGNPYGLVNETDPRYPIPITYPSLLGFLRRIQ